MNIDAKYHPTPEQLEGFAQGSLAPGMNVVISAHVELCATCRQSITELEEAASEEWLRSTPDTRASSINFSAMIDSIVDHPQIKSDDTA
ncbi:MAG: hypothetical protein ACPGJC_01305, partial [Pseudohongiellaceae bacterium]